MKVILTIVTQSFVQAWKRYAFIGSTIALVTMLFTSMLALSAGFEKGFVQAASLLGTGHVNVAGFYKPSPTNTLGLIKDEAAVRQLVADTFPQAGIIARDRGSARLYSAENSTIPSWLTGIDAAQEGALLSFLRPADGYGESDFAGVSRGNGLILFEAQASRLGVVVGDQLTARGEYGEGMINTVDLTVAGVAKNVGMPSSWTFFVSRDTAKSLYQRGPGTASTVQVYLDDYRTSTSSMSELRRAFEAQDGFELTQYAGGPHMYKLRPFDQEPWTGQRLDLSTWSDEISYIAWVLQTLDAMAVLVLIVLLVMIGIGILNTMLMSIRERSQELGTLRAIGMRRSSLLFMILLEATVLGVVAGTIGATAGFAAMLFVDSMQIAVPSEALRQILLTDVITAAPRPVHVAVSVIVVATFAVLASFWPAVRAARLSPVTAMQEVD